MKKERAWFCFTLICLGTLWWYMYVYKPSRLQKNKLITIGKIKDWDPASKGTLSIDFEFLFRNNLIKGRCGLRVSNELVNYFYANGISVPVALDTTDLSSAFLLLTEDQFEYAGLPYPDSMKVHFAKAAEWSQIDVQDQLDAIHEENKKIQKKIDSLRRGIDSFSGFKLNSEPPPGSKSYILK